MKTACVKMDSRNLGEDQRSWKESTYVLNFGENEICRFFELCGHLQPNLALSL